MYAHMTGTSELSEDVEPHDVPRHHLPCIPAANSRSMQWISTSRSRNPVDPPAAYSGAFQ